MYRSDLNLCSTQNLCLAVSISFCHRLVLTCSIIVKTRLKNDFFGFLMSVMLKPSLGVRSTKKVEMHAVVK